MDKFEPFTSQDNKNSGNYICECLTVIKGIKVKGDKSRFSGPVVFDGPVSFNNGTNSTLKNSFCFVRQSGGAAINDGDTLQFNVVDSDVTTMFTAPSTVTIPYNGIYTITVGMLTLGPTTAVTIFVNGIAKINNSSLASLQTSLTIPLNKGDTITTKFQYSSPLVATSLIADPLANYLMVTRIA